MRLDSKRSTSAVATRDSAGTREKLFAAAISSVAEKGYAATAVDDICNRAGVTKGAFFHHFPSKQSLTVAAVNDWAEKCATYYAGASYHQFKDPLDRVLGFLDFRKGMLRAPRALISCPVGTMIQEVFDTHPDILRACEECISGQVAAVETDIAEAMKLYGVSSGWTPRSLALHTHSVLQGIYILAKASADVEVGELSIDHLHRYVESLFRQSITKRASSRLTRNSAQNLPRSAGNKSHFRMLRKPARSKKTS